ncbi:MAG: site-specific integrase [Janthinobacterium lividum]
MHQAKPEVGTHVAFDADLDFHGPREATTPAVVSEDRLHEQARAFVRASKAVSTLRAYRSDWQHFLSWCESRGAAALPATSETVALYLVALAETHRPATITRRLTSIAKAHAAAREPNPATTQHILVAETLQGIRRTLGTAQPGKTPLLTADLIQVLAHLPAGLSGVRDRALLLVGYTGGLRRSELAALTAEDLEWKEEGAILTLRRSKTDQEGQGRKVAIPRGVHAATCPVRALRGWLEAAAIQAGALFREIDRHGRIGERGLHRDSVGAILKRAVARAGFDPANYGGHSLRAGFATQAARNGATAFDIMRQTGHRSITTVSRYVRDAQIFRDAPAGKLGL